VRKWRYSSTVLDLALDRGEWSALLSGRFIPQEVAISTHCTESWVRHRAGLDDVGGEKDVIGIQGVEPVAVPTEPSVGSTAHDHIRID
jgi:hypothetical protein